MSESELPKEDLDNEAEVINDSVANENSEDQPSPGIEIVIGEQIPDNPQIELVESLPPAENDTGSSLMVDKDDTVTKSSDGLVLLDVEVGEASPPEGAEGATEGESQNANEDDIEVAGTDGTTIDGEAGDKVEGEREAEAVEITGEEGEKVEGGEIPVDNGEKVEDGEVVNEEGAEIKVEAEGDGAQVETEGGDVKVETEGGDVKAETDGEKPEGGEAEEKVEEKTATTQEEEKLDGTESKLADAKGTGEPIEDEFETYTMKKLAASEDDFLLDQPSVTSLVSEESDVDVPASGQQSPDLPIDRDFWCEMYKSLILERTNLQRKNSILQRKLQEHFKKRKMDNLFKPDTQASPELDAKYTKKLAMYNEMRNVEETDRIILRTELEDLNEEEEKLSEELKEELADLIALERETGTGLINTKTGKSIPDKVVQRFLSRQENKVYEVGQYRLAYIKIRDKVNEKEAAMKGLENIGENLHMIDYEQLRMENQNLCDKIEERDDELARLRERTTQSIQILAHFKEKSFAVLKDIDTKADDLKMLEEELDSVRAKVNSLKHTRDKLRADCDREKKEAGLLTKPKLLRDFEEAIELSAKMSEELENLQNTCADEQQQLAEIRKSIERGTAMEFKPRESYMDKLEKKRSQRKAWRERKARMERGEAAIDDEESEYIFQM